MLTGNPIGAIKAQQDKKKAAQIAANSTVADGAGFTEIPTGEIPEDAYTQTSVGAPVGSNTGTSPTPSSDGKILGMKKPVFYGVLGLTTVLLIVGGVVIYKRMKK